MRPCRSRPPAPAAGQLLPLLLTLGLGCSTFGGAAEVPTEFSPRRTLETVIEARTTPEYAVVDRLPEASFYGAVRISSRGIPSAYDECFREDGLWNQLFRVVQSAAGVERANTFVLTMDIETPDEALLYDDFPLLVVSRSDGSNGGPRECLIDGAAVSNPELGLIVSPYFRMDGRFQLDFRFDVKYARDANIDTARRIVAFSTALASRIGGHGAAVSAIGRPLLRGNAAGLDAAIAHSLRGVATETVSGSLTRGSGFRTPADSLVLDIGKYLGEPEGEHVLQVELDYRRTVLGVTTDAGEALYSDDPAVLLGVHDAANGSSAYGYLQSEGLPKFNPSHLLALRGGPGDRAHFEHACAALSGYFGVHLQMTSDDALVARYAALRAFSNYSETPALWSNTCFTGTYTGGRDGQSDRLFALNHRFDFVERTQVSSFRAEIKRRIDTLIRSAAHGNTTSFAPDFVLKVIGRKHLPPAFLEAHPGQGEPWIATGNDGVAALHALIKSGGKCGMTEENPPSGDGFRKLAFFARYMPESWAGYRGLRDANTMLIPMVATYATPTRITSVTIAEPSLLRDDEQINPRWPQCGRRVYAHVPEEPIVAAAEPEAPAESEAPAENTPTPMNATEIAITGEVSAPELAGAVSDPLLPPVAAPPAPGP